MSNKRRPGFEIMCSATYWKEFHEARRAREARAANCATNNADTLTGDVYTFVPGRDEPFVSVAGAPRRSAAKSARSGPATGSTRKKKVYTPPKGSNSILASRAHADEMLMRNLALGRAQSRIQMARRGHLNEPGNFVGKTDAEIIAHMKTPRGQQQLADAQAKGRRWVEECRQKANAAPTNASSKSAS
ncbi:hypothetical protein B0H13DRAFT_2379552 [Mycena leptocephala]|nr:hypothetical protein B0H13DRAFT_2379552 [Mycena leptocephala]